MVLQNLHNWRLTPKQAIELQKQLAARVNVSTPLDVDAVRLVAGVDVSVKDGLSQVNGNEHRITHE